MYSINVIVPYYNDVKTIHSCIKSIASQSGLGVEFTFKVAIVDDGSDIPCPDLSHYSNKNMEIYQISKVNGGVASARNAGLSSLPPSDFVAFLDSDDVWNSNKTTLMVSTMVSKDIVLLGSFSTSHRFFKSTVLQPRAIKFSQQLLRNYFLTSTVIIKCSNIPYAAVIFPENQTHAEEGDLFLRITKHHKAGVMPIVLVEYDGGKRGYGDRGLSANLKQMHMGEKLNYMRCFARSDISFTLLNLLLAYAHAKYVRRVIANAIRRFKSKEM